MANMEIEYHSGKKETFESANHNAKSLKKELKTAGIHKSIVWKLKGFSFRELVKRKQKYKISKQKNASLNLIKTALFLYNK